ncbi:hypothetical protein KM043_010229 [Ampulex compressa]|nr:hypothetical protein KM043_010229 [Ampulex compressa]
MGSAHYGGVRKGGCRTCERASRSLSRRGRTTGLRTVPLQREPTPVTHGIRKLAKPDLLVSFTCLTGPRLRPAFASSSSFRPPRGPHLYKLTCTHTCAPRPSIPRERAGVLVPVRVQDARKDGPDGENWTLAGLSDRPGDSYCRLSPSCRQSARLFLLATSGGSRCAPLLRDQA